MSECSKYRELICSLVDEELNTQTREALLSHIEGCGECKALYEAFSALSAAVSENIEEVPEALHENIMAGVRRSALRSKNKQRSLRQSRSLLAAAACFAVVIMSAVGISKTMESRRGDVVNDMAAVKAETQAAAADTAEAAKTAETAPTAIPQANASTPSPKPASSVNPVSTPVPPVQESTEDIDEFGGMRSESVDEDAAVSPVQSGVNGIEIPDAQASTEPAASQPQSGLYSLPAEQSEGETQEASAENENAAAQAAESPAADSAVSEQPSINAAAAGTQQAETHEDTGSVQSDSTPAPAVSAAEATAESSASPVEQEAKPGRFSAGFRGLFSALAPAATSAPEAEKLPEADVYFTLTGDKDYEELSKLLLGTLSELPIETPDRTYLVSIEREENPIVLIMRAYGDKLYYSIYDELILQNVLLADCKPEALEKFILEHTDAQMPEETDAEPISTEVTAGNTFIGTDIETTGKNDKQA